MHVIYDPDRQRIPIKVWAADVDDATVEQAMNVARLPFAAHHVALMPDAHLGYSLPVGGVLATRGYVIPVAVGVDAGCGMHARRTNIEVGRLAERHPGQGTVLRAVLNQIQRAVPAGNGPAGNHAAPQVWTDPLADPEITALLDQAPPELAQAWRDSGLQLGTLGGGEVLATPV